MKIFQTISKRKESCIVYGFLILFFIASATVSLLRYYQFQSFYFDFGIVDRALWLVAHFKAPVVFHPNFHGVEKVIFADHFNPSMFLLAPLYWITNKREIFFVVQALVVTLSGFVAYQFSKRCIKNSFVRVGLLCCYLLFVGLQNAMISDIHDATFATLPVMLMFWAIEKKKWKTYFIMMFIILGLKETFAGLVIGIGLYAAWKRQFTVAISTILISCMWLFVAIQFVIPYFSGQPYFYSSGANANFSIIALLTPFEKIKTLFFSFLSFGFLPLFYPPLWPAIFENFFERFVTLSNTRWGLGLHYSATLSPLFFVSSVNVIAFLQRKKVPNAFLTSVGIALICIAVILHRFILHGPLGLFYNPAFYASASKVQYIDNFIADIPKNGLIMTQQDIAVRLTHYNVTLLDTNFPVTEPHVIALNVTPGLDPNVYFPKSQFAAIAMKNSLLKDPHYVLKKYGNELYVFIRK